MNDPENIGSVVLLGVQGSGKTVFLSVLDHGFMEPAAFGLSLSGREDTPTSDYARGKFDHMREQGDWPPSTNDREFFELTWVVRSGVHPLFTLASIDCAGEAIVKALAPGYQAGDGAGGSPTQKTSGDTWDNDDGTPQAGDGDMAERIRERVAAAKVICLFLNPNDFERHIDDGGDDIGGKEDVKAARQRSGAMKRLLDAFLVGPQGEGKRIVLVITQAEQGHRSRTIEETGGAKAFLFDQNHWLESRERALSARVVAVSAVNHVVWRTLEGERVEPDDGNRDESRLQIVSWAGPMDGRPHFAPREFPDIRQEDNSSGLVEFLLAVGGPLSPELDLLDRALGDLRERQHDCAMAARDDNSGATDRLRRAESLAEAWETYNGLAEAFLSNPARKITDRVKNQTKLHHDEEKGRLLHWFVTGREVDAALRAGAATGLYLDDSSSCDAFRAGLVQKINNKIEATTSGRESPCREIGTEDLPSDKWLHKQLMEYRANLHFDDKAAKALAPDEGRNSPKNGGSGGKIALVVFLLVVSLLVVLALIVKACLGQQP